MVSMLLPAMVTDMLHPLKSSFFDGTKQIVCWHPQGAYLSIALTAAITIDITDSLNVTAQEVQLCAQLVTKATRHAGRQGNVQRPLPAGCCCVC